MFETSGLSEHCAFNFLLNRNIQYLDRLRSPFQRHCRNNRRRLQYRRLRRVSLRIASSAIGVKKYIKILG